MQLQLNSTYYICNIISKQITFTFEVICIYCVSIFYIALLQYTCIKATSRATSSKYMHCLLMYIKEKFIGNATYF